MGGLPAWMPVLLERINTGCASSPWLADLADDNRVLGRARNILFELWPYVRELPQNIRAVRKAVPEQMTAAAQLLDRLCDSELQYQKLFLQQFDLAGISVGEVESQTMSRETSELCRSMSKLCTESGNTENGYVDGIYAIVAAELTATVYCRLALPLYECYFDKHKDEYEPELIEAGFAWVRLHAKNHTRHAIWMKRMLNDVEVNPSEHIPAAAALILNAVLALWGCTAESLHLATGKSN